ncbi:hypothetical protein JCM10449v2_005740 [Rhodotorula kratochvilovae]
MQASPPSAQGWPRRVPVSLLPPVNALVSFQPPRLVSREEGCGRWTGYSGETSTEEEAREPVNAPPSGGDDPVEEDDGRQISAMGADAAETDMEDIDGVPVDLDDVYGDADGVPIDLDAAAPPAVASSVGINVERPTPREAAPGRLFALSVAAAAEGEPGAWPSPALSTQLSLPSARHTSSLPTAQASLPPRPLSITIRGAAEGMKRARSASPARCSKRSDHDLVPDWSKLRFSNFEPFLLEEPIETTYSNAYYDAHLRFLQECAPPAAWSPGCRLQPNKAVIRAALPPLTPMNGYDDLPKNEKRRFSSMARVLEWLLGKDSVTLSETMHFARAAPRRSTLSHSSLASLDAHHRTYHAFVCTAAPPSYNWAVAKGRYEGREHYAGSGEEKELVCGRVFPDDRLLELHFTECHDEMAQLRRERGEKIFACFQPACTQLFATPKGRRLHLIEKHAYPSQFYFGVTIWGIEDVLKKGGGMVRLEWKPREGQPGWRGETRASSDDSFGSPPSPAQPVMQELPRAPEQPAASSSKDVDDLAAALSGISISLVPRAVRLARKNKMATDT